MRRSLQIFAAVAALAACIYCYFTFDEFKKIVDAYVFGVQETPPTPSEAPEEWLYLIADGTGSRKEYAIPELKGEWLAELIDSVHLKTGGRIWLSHVDSDSKNNQVCYINIPKVKRTLLRPRRQSGQTSFDYAEKKKEWGKKHPKSVEDSIAHEKAFLKEKARFLKEWDSLSTTVYDDKSPLNRWSDVYGSLNGGYISLLNDSTTLANRRVIAFSDLKHDVENKSVQTSKNVEVIAVNQVPIADMKFQALKLEAPDRVLEHIFSPKK